MYARTCALTNFWSSYYTTKGDKKVLFVMGKGFDPRMNNNIKLLTETVDRLNIECVLIDFPYTDTPVYKDLIERNEKELATLSTQYNFLLNHDVHADFSNQWESGIKNLCGTLANIEFERFSDVIVDISSLPRSIYFNVLRTLYSKIEDNRVNLFAIVSENVEMDNSIEERHYKEVSPIWGFSAKLGRSSLIGNINISIPLIGEGRTEVLKKIITEFQADDVCPVLPFPSKDPRRSDKLLLEYNEIFRDILEIEPQKIAYAHEQNPFELYCILNQLISNYKASLRPLNTKISFGISILTSKLLSLGALLVALERREEVAIFNVTAEDYKINITIDEFVLLNDKSEPFLMWITGDAYK
jgi:hypothetical protein